MARVMIPVLALEFEEGGDTLWIQGLGETVLRIKTTGKVTSEECRTSPYTHGDVTIDQDIKICIGFEQHLSSEYFDKVGEVVKGMLADRGIPCDSSPSSASSALSDPPASPAGSGSTAQEQSQVPSGKAASSSATRRSTTRTRTGTRGR